MAQSVNSLFIQVAIKRLKGRLEGIDSVDKCCQQTVVMMVKQ